MVAQPGSQDEDRKARHKAFTRHPDASYAEFICWEWLTRARHLKEGVDFLFRPRFAGDFYFPGRRLSWLIRGDTFRPTPSIALTLASMRSRGLNVIQLRSRDVETRTEYALARALRGEQVG